MSDRGVHQPNFTRTDNRVRMAPKKMVIGHSHSGGDRVQTTGHVKRSDIIMQ